MIASKWGSSPLTRGKLWLSVLSDLVSGLIPAHAGKTTVSISAHPACRAHPRSRGENRGVWCASLPHPGSSPLTRGKLRRIVSPGRKRGLIPAHAGKTLPDLRFYCADRSDLGNP